MLHFGSREANLQSTLAQAILPCSGLHLPLPSGPSHRHCQPLPQGPEACPGRPTSNPFSICPIQVKPDGCPKPAPPTQNLSWSHCPARQNLTRCQITQRLQQTPPTPTPFHSDCMKTVCNNKEMCWGRRLWVVSFTLFKEFEIFIVSLTVQYFLPKRYIGMEIIFKIINLN